MPATRLSMTAPDPPDTVDALRARLAALEAELAACHRERDDLHRDAQRLRALTDSSPAAVAFVDGTRLVYINPAGQVITGFSQE
ncbi:MAG: PAS domain-containing protein, partial [Candidatus Eiseniibacteriota bacterium]